MVKHLKLLPCFLSIHGLEKEKRKKFVLILYFK